MVDEETAKFLENRKKMIRNSFLKFFKKRCAIELPENGTLESYGQNE